MTFYRCIYCDYQVAMSKNMQEPAEKTPFQSNVIGPIVTKEMFSAATGLRVDQVRGMMSNGYLPTLKVGKHRMINIALLTQECLQEDIDV